LERQSPGDVPAIDQDVATPKTAKERLGLLHILEPLPDTLQAELVALWDEYESAASPEARLAKALDKLETIMQHNQGLNPEEFDYRFNLGYGQQYTGGHPVIVALRAALDRETRRLAEKSQAGSRTEGQGVLILDPATFVYSLPSLCLTDRAFHGSRAFE
jgi:putative hydrolase of HD superfamily